MNSEKFKDGVIVVLRLEKKYNFLRIIDFFGSKKNYNSALNFVINFAKNVGSTPRHRPFALTRRNLTLHNSVAYSFDPH